MPCAFSTAVTQAVLNRPTGSPVSSLNTSASAGFFAAVGIELQPFEHRSQPRRRDRHEPRLLALGRLAAQRDQAAREVDVAEPKREHLALAHAGVEGGDDHRPQERRRRLPGAAPSSSSEIRPASLVVFAQLANRAFRFRGGTACGRWSSRPTAQFIMWRMISTVRLIDAGDRSARRLPSSSDVAASAESAMKSSTSPVRISAQRPIAEVLDDRPQAVVDRLADRELFREDVTLLVDSPRTAGTSARRLGRRARRPACRTCRCERRSSDHRTPLLLRSSS